MTSEENKNEKWSLFRTLLALCIIPLGLFVMMIPFTYFVGPLTGLAIVVYGAIRTARELAKLFKDKALE